MIPARNDAFQANLAALAESHSHSTALVERADLAVDFRRATGRDGSETFIRKSGDDQDQWLGRTSMPTVSASALIEAFDSGLGNVLLYTFGQGAEVRLLVDRLHPHQAVFVVEPDAAALRAALELGDFGADLRAGRLQLFAGEDAWRQMERFLIENPGYLVPQRILARPWFDSSLVQGLRDQMTELAERVARGREATVKSDGRVTPTGEFVAILSNRPDEEVIRWAGELAAAARRIGWESLRFVLDDPALVEPSIAEGAIGRGGCRAAIIIGAAPQSLPYKLPQGPCAVLTLPAEPWPDWNSQVSEECWIAAPGRADTPRRRILRYGPAVPDWCADAQPLRRGGKVGIVADYMDTSAEGAGLELASHQHLWRAAGEVLAMSFDRSRATRSDMAPPRLLREAEKRLGIELRAREVRAGLEERIDRILLPAMFQEMLARAVKRSGHEFIYFGRGWGAIESTHSRAWSPAVADSWDDIGSIIVPQRDWSSRQKALLAAALGLPVFIRGPLPDEADDPLRMLKPFDSLEEAVSLLDGLAGTDGATMGDDRAVRDEILRQHTWSARLGAILAAMGVSK